VKISNGKVENMVGSFDCGIDLELISLASKIGFKALFKPELFPGLIYTLHNKYKATLFRLGKINITKLNARKNSTTPLVICLLIYFI
jgi:TATA-box binding protein (TBP) (component of TFIID and TFIIIB)